MLNKIDFSSEKTKDFIAGLIALVFVVTAGYMALNRFNNPEDKELGKGGELSMEEVAEGTDMRLEDGSVAGTSTISSWVATDYKQGDISSGTYTVKEGDTLWEISEAVYGDGTMWNKILEANASDVGFLPNGSQALIITGQTLTIPQ